MQFVVFIRRFFQLFIVLLSGSIAMAQSCLYADREMLFDDTKEHMQMMLSPDGNTHVWRWGTGRVTMDVYDRQLHRVHTDIVAKQGQRLLFASFKNFYYVLLVESKRTRVLCVKQNEWEDKTADFNRIPTEDMSIDQIRQSNGLWFFMQYGPATDNEHSQMHITAVDSNLHFINAMHLTLRYTASQLRRVQIHTVGNNLLLLQTKVEDSAMKLTIHQLNIYQGTVHSNSFLFEDELFTPQEILPVKNGFLVQGQASRPLLPPRYQTAYTRLLLVDSNLQQTGCFCTATAGSASSAKELCYYLPVSTTILPGNQLLVADFRRQMNLKDKGVETQLRLHRLDSALGTINSMVQPSRDYSGYPALVFCSGPQVFVFYEEIIKSNIAVVHHYRYGEGPETDRIVQLNPKNKYFMKSALRTGESSFVMPYLRNYKLGLVRVNVPVE